ncbi:predicted protein [Chaetomium globosum CBS 148.51]|uniref:Uncharacterized protein n=1 Tax=Chaetomium globosum (strain ATCC 6205 / CBS 148.51 / DSM 1962 / NBRC 6347 / NRRL 1970) TaxID=306901 RepID=Q2H2U3_CHAGB|nr:uncharacterized protein CHGG_03903 [Chaetomium globosum CBS 148.51]EAQ87284.1 predicted protein [Chaetomium globosum CBS 148.51]
MSIICHSTLIEHKHIASLSCVHLEPIVHRRVNSSSPQNNRDLPRARTAGGCFRTRQQWNVDRAVLVPSEHPSITRTHVPAQGDNNPGSKDALSHPRPDPGMPPHPVPHSECPPSRSSSVIPTLITKRRMMYSHPEHGHQGIRSSSLVSTQPPFSARTCICPALPCPTPFPLPPLKPTTGARSLTPRAKQTRTPSRDVEMEMEMETGTTLEIRGPSTSNT